MIHQSSYASTPLVFIGDIHGQYDVLIRLLKRLGFTKTGGIWCHDEATAVFLGDLIDQGPKSREVVDTVRAMVEAGQAYCIMANHELNAIHYHTPDGKGGHLRIHSDKNTKQHTATLESYRNNDAALNEALTWFKTLPIALDFGNCRAIHATWSQSHLCLFKRNGPGYYFSSDAQITQSAIQETPVFDAVEILLKGAEIELPNGACFLDKSNSFWRKKARLNWWRQSHPNWRNAITVPSWPEGIERNGKAELPDACQDLLYPEDAPPVFFGHYWMSGPIRLQAHNAFCADYSAGRGDRLCAYWWDGEQRLMTDKIISVNV